jgi:hypothetical protein
MQAVRREGSETGQDAQKRNPSDRMALLTQFLDHPRSYLAGDRPAELLADRHSLLGQ